MPAAKQMESVGQATESREPLYPLGTAWGVQIRPPSVVARMDAPGPGDADPTATQCVVSEHAMALKLVTVAGEVSMVQEAPPFVVPMMLAELEPKAVSVTAWQVEVLAHETPVTGPVVDGPD